MLKKKVASLRTASLKLIGSHLARKTMWLLVPGLGLSLPLLGSSEEF